MATRGSEEQLLFGVLAVQLGFATPQQVMAAGAAWMADRERSLVERLRGDGVLDERQAQLLDSLLAEAVRTHDGDVRRTLDVLGGDAAVQQSFAGSLVLEPNGAVIAARATSEPDAGPAYGTDDAAGAAVGPGEPQDAVTEENRGRYSLGDECGRGGQARVLLAVDRHIGREIAWKEMLAAADGPSTSAASGSSRSHPASLRFLREARITGQLEHPNIVPVHEVGRRADGSLYYTMRLVRGRTLAAALAACATLGERLRLLESFVAVCHAIAFAHSRGVIHRDIKPDNVMVGEHGETVVLDWGLAKAHGREDVRGRDLERQLERLRRAGDSHTMDGAALGTPSYMSPEQAAGEVEAIDERSDVWSLGAVLYEILCGRPPHSGETPFEIVGRAMAEPVQPVAERNPAAPPELAAVAEKALAREPAVRYTSAGALAEEVSHYLTGGRVRAYAYSSWDLLKRFAAKNKLAMAAAGLALAVVLAALVLIGLAYQQEADARQAEARARLRERHESRQASFHLAQAYAEKADRLIGQRRFGTARLFAAASLLRNPAYRSSPVHDPDFSERRPASRDLLVTAGSRIYRSRHSTRVALQRVWKSPNMIKRLAFSPDGGRLAGAVHDGRIAVWPLRSDEAEQRWKAHGAGAYSVLFLDEQRLVSGGDGGQLRIWDLAGPSEQRRLIGHSGNVMALALAPDGRRLASGSVDESVRLWDLTSGRCTAVLRGHGGAVWAVAFSPDGRRVASGAWDKTVRIWDAASGRLERVLDAHDDAVYAVAFSPDGRQLASACYDSRIRLFDPASGLLLRTLESHEDAVYDLDFSPDGALLGSAGFDRSLRLFDAASGEQLYGLAGHLDAVGALRMAPDGRHFATSGFDNSVRLWRIHRAREVAALDFHSDWVYAVDFGPRGRRLLSSSWDRSAVIWDLASGEMLHRLEGLKSGSMAAAFSPRGERVAAADVKGWLGIWDANSGKRLQLRQAHPEWIYSVAFSPDGRQLLTCSRDRSARIWDAVSGRRRLTLEGHGDMLQNCAYSPDGRLVATTSRDRTARLWDARSGELLRVLEGHDDWVSGVDFAPDGRRLATSGKDGRVLLWEVAGGRLLQRLERHRQWVNRVVFSPDGRRLASASDDSTVVLWSAASGRALLELQAGAGVIAIDFSPDGRRLAVGDHRSIKLYPLDFALDDIDARAELQQAQAEIGLRLRGFELEPAN